MFGFISLMTPSLNTFDELLVNWRIGLSSWPDVKRQLFLGQNRPCSLGDIWLIVCMLTAALFVISGDLDPILDYGQVKSHYENLQTRPAPPNKSWWVARTQARAHSHTI